MRRRKITLIKAEAKRTNIYSAFAYPGLALPVVGTALQERGYDVKIYVEVVRPWDWDRIRESDLIGLTVNSAEVKECYALADRIRAECGAPIVMGGYHVTYMAPEALDHCDYVVRGEGEATMVELADTLLAGDGNVERIAGISYCKNGDVINNPNRPLLQNIDLIPDQGLIEGYAAYHRRWFQPFFPTGALVATTRGCPYDCTFCSIIEIYDRTTRFRSHEAVIEDIRRQTALTGRRYVYFADDNFTAHIRKCKDLLRSIIAAKVDIKFSAQCRLEFTQDDEFVELMKAAGCYMVFIGYESINPRTLVDFSKRQTVEEIVSSIERLHRAKIHVHGMFIVGGDTDTVDTVRATGQFVIDHYLDSMQICPLSPLPGTQLMKQLQEERRLFLTINPDTGKYELEYGVGNFVLMQTKNINPVDLQHELVDVYRRFYSLKNILRSLVQGPSLESTVIKLVGRYLVGKGRRQTDQHVAWLREHGFDKNWDEWQLRHDRPASPAGMLMSEATRIA
jgi:radical SAM superfamily enzyme YgiQ (UPF0313 family)